MLGLLTASAVVAGVALAVMAGYVWRRGGSPAGLSLAVLLLSVAWWAAAYAMELSTTDLVVRGRWGDLKYIGIGLLPPAWLVFVAQYTGRGRLVTRRRLLLLAIEPAAVLVLLVVPATHDLVRFYRASTASDQIPVVGSGPLFWVVLGYANALLLAATAIFVQSMVRLSRVYRVAAAVLVAAALLPWVANLAYNFEIGPFARLDLTPFAFVVTGGVLVWGLHRERLINLSAVAWGLVVATMTDGVILRDAFGRVSDVNPAAVRVLGLPRADLIGRDLGELLPGHPAPVAESQDQGTGEEAAGDGQDTEVTLTVDGQIRQFELRRQMLPGTASARAGELVMLRDITARKESEARLRELLAERTRIAAALQSSMLPPALPSIPGCELAALYEPAGTGHEVGGDFYDLFPIDGGRWGIVLGDVSGKGAPAAAATGLIRYTLRTLAMGHTTPSQVLRRLNDVLLRDSDDERYCTLVYAVARRTPAGVELRLCLGGYHPPLLRHSDGRVEPVGILGTALGLVPDPALTDTTVRMRPGDLLCLFTDRLVEARNQDALFGSERAASLLTLDQSPDPQSVVDRLAKAARDFHHGPLSDDLALLALSVPHSADEQQAEAPSGASESVGSAQPAVPDDAKVTGTGVMARTP